MGTLGPKYILFGYMDPQGKIWGARAGHDLEEPWLAGDHDLEGLRTSGLSGSYGLKDIGLTL